MDKLLVSLMTFWNDITGTEKEKGATGTEYALLVAFVALVLIVGATFFGGQLSAWFTTLGNEIAGWNTSP